MQGKIVKGIAGFYYVYVENQGLYECKAKGILRFDRQKPLVGDLVEIEVLDCEAKLGNIIELLKRKNTLIRPQVANIDQALVVFALTKPVPNFIMTDKMILQYKLQNVPIILCFNKEDLVTDEETELLERMYGESGCTLLVTSTKTEKGISELQKLLQGKTTTVAGPSGVGKSSLVNCLQKNVTVETGAISEKADRGKHTTRHSEIFRIAEKTYLMDTPGFSSFELFDMDCEDIWKYYDEFLSYADCRFQPCTHTHEPDCGVKAAVEAGIINENRYKNYVQIFGELKNQRRH